jgi:hypothetical protein
MRHFKTEYRFRNAVEVYEYHTVPPEKGEKRSPRRKATPEEMAKVNQKNKERLIRHRLRTYFGIKDYWVTLTYERSLRPESMDQARHQMRLFVQKLQRRYKKHGKTLYCLANIEVGSRGGWHIHMAINRIADLDLMLAECWQYGMADIKTIRQKPDDPDWERRIAAYLAKTPLTDPRLSDAKRFATRNMPLQEPVKKEYVRMSFRKIKIPEDYELHKPSYEEGINPVTGYAYRHYTLLRVRRI